MKIGKLYQANEYFWFLYHSKDSAAALADAAIANGTRSAAAAASSAAYWSKHFNCNVSYVFPNSIFCCLEQDEKFIKILTINGEVGWIRAGKWQLLDIEEVNQ
jgi:hypothetical protein